MFKLVIRKEFSTTLFFPQGQEMYRYPANSGHVMTQYPGGVPVAVPMQAVSGMVPVQAVTPGPQGGQPQMVVVPVSGMVGNQPQFATSGAMTTGYQPQVVTSGAMTTGYQPQFAQVATSGAVATGYTKMENEEV